MNELREVLKKNNLKATGYKYIGKVKIIDTDKGKIVYKNNCNNYDKYEYLKTRGFDNFPRYLNQKNDKYEILEYIKTKDIPKEQKIIDLIHLSAKLHRCTSYNKEVDIDEIKEIYEEIMNKVNYLTRYYQDLNDYIDRNVFMSPSEYLLVSNIDIINYLLNFIRVELNNWYEFIKEKKVIRYSMIHNNLDTSHLLESDKTYLISWDLARQDMPIIDLIKIYEDNYYEIDLDNFVNEYEKINQFEYYEYLFFLIKLAIPKKLEFTRNTYNDCYNISNYLIYLTKIVSLVQKTIEKRKKV